MCRTPRRSGPHICALRTIAHRTLSPTQKDPRALPREFEMTDQERIRLHDFYRTLHAHPELSMQEHQTAARLETVLSDLDVEHFRCADTGVVAVVHNGEGPVVAMRADMDGLPIEEKTALEYAAQQRGVLPNETPTAVMHGCGHDTHVASCRPSSPGRWMPMMRRWSPSVSSRAV